MHEDRNDDLTISARPNALVLFDPTVVLSPISGEFEFSDARVTDLNNNAPFIDTVNKMDAFLVSLGYLKGAPETIHSE